MKEKILNNKTALIIGANRGIGKAIALEFCHQGSAVIISGRTTEELSKTLSECQAFTNQIYSYQVDITSHGQVSELIHYALGKLGEIDIFINCAGIHGAIGPFSQVDLDEWVNAIKVNLIGSVIACKAVLPSMISHKKGKIILMSGGGATSPMPNFSAYATSKAGLVRFIETLAVEVAQYNIQVNAIAPGMVDTKLQEAVLSAGENAGDEYNKVLKARLNGKGFVSPQQAADLAVFLASDQSGELTGKLISAPHDPWREWQGKLENLNKSSLYTLRRIDPYTIMPILDELI